MAFATTLSFGSTVNTYDTGLNPYFEDPNWGTYWIDSAGNTDYTQLNHFKTAFARLTQNTMVAASKLFDIHSDLGLIYTRVLDIRDTLVNHATIVSSNFTLINTALSGISGYLSNIYLDQADIYTILQHIDGGLYDANGNSLVNSIALSASDAARRLQTLNTTVSNQELNVRNIKNALVDSNNNTNAISELELIRSAVGGLKHDNHVDLNAIYQELYDDRSVDWHNGTIVGYLIDSNNNRIDTINQSGRYFFVFNNPNGFNSRGNLLFIKTGITSNYNISTTYINNYSFTFQNTDLNNSINYNYFDSLFISNENNQYNTLTFLIDMPYTYSSSYNLYIGFDVHVSNSTFTYSGNNYFKYLTFYDKDYFLVHDYLTNDSINTQLANLNNTFDNSDVIDAINDLELINHGDEKINVTLTSVEATQTTGLIVKLRQMFSTGVSISDFNTAIGDSSLLGWFTQSNSDELNALNNSYVAPAY